LEGGGGADRFFFEAGDSGTSVATADEILDFDDTDEIWLEGQYVETKYGIDDGNMGIWDLNNGTWAVLYNPNNGVTDDVHYIIVSSDPHDQIHYF